MAIIELTQGQITIVDDWLFKFLDRYNWYAQNHTGKFYAHGTIVSKKEVFLHRFLMGLPNKEYRVDHINHNTLDNRLCNLRICNQSENCANSKKQKYTLSKYKGVHFHKIANKYCVEITHNYKQYYLGLFKSEIKAARVYNNAAKELFGEFAYLNKV